MLLCYFPPDDKRVLILSRRPLRSSTPQASDDLWLSHRTRYTWRPVRCRCMNSLYIVDLNSGDSPFTACERLQFTLKREELIRFERRRKNECPPLTTLIFGALMVDHFQR